MNGPEQLLVPDFIAFTVGIVVVFLGALLTRRVAFLRDFNIPEPVSGGLAVALATWAIYVWFDVEIVFELSARDTLLVIFFATIGLNARFADLVAGGRLLGVLLVMTLAFIILQNLVGLAGTSLFGLLRELSVLVGSAALIGGHGTAIAWGPTVAEVSGFATAAEVGITAATLGLVCAALIGGPIAKFLIDRNRLQAGGSEGPIVGVPYRGEEAPASGFDHIDLMRALLAVNIAVIIGYAANEFIAAAGLKLPLFVPCLIVAIVLSNTVPVIFPGLPWPARSRALAVLSDFCLSLFLAMSLMSMQLWALAGLGGSLVGILALQVAAATVFILLVFYRIAGSDYTAAVLSAGFAGFTLGATPTVIANMSSVTKRYGPAPLAFIVLPLVSAFFVDLANAVVIRYFVGG